MNKHDVVVWWETRRAALRRALGYTDDNLRYRHADARRKRQSSGDKLDSALDDVTSMACEGAVEEARRLALAQAQE